jgi:hypothetical protein
MITVDGQVLGVREAYDSCQGVLLCKGKLGREFDVIDFKKEYGDDGAAYFVQRLLYSAHAPGSTSTTQDGRNVSLTRF